MSLHGTGLKCDILHWPIKANRSNINHLISHIAFFLIVPDESSQVWAVQSGMDSYTILIKNETHISINHPTKFCKTRQKRIGKRWFMWWKFWFGSILDGFIRGGGGSLIYRRALLFSRRIKVVHAMLCFSHGLVPDVFCHSIPCWLDAQPRASAHGK